MVTTLLIVTQTGRQIAIRHTDDLLAQLEHRTIIEVKCALVLSSNMINNGRDPVQVQE